MVTTHVQLEIGEKVVQKGAISFLSLCDLIYYKYIIVLEKTIESLSIARRLNELYRNRGMKGIFSGLSIRLYKVVPSCAIMISVFECGNRYFYNYDRRKN